MARKQPKPSLVGLKYADIIVERVSKHPELAIEALPILLNLEPRYRSQSTDFPSLLERFIDRFPQVVDKAIELTTAQGYDVYRGLQPHRIGIIHRDAAGKVIDALKSMAGDRSIYQLRSLGQYSRDSAIPEQVIATITSKEDEDQYLVSEAIIEIARWKPDFLSVAVDALLQLNVSATKILKFIDEPGFSDWQVGSDYKNGEVRKNLATRVFDVIATKPATQAINDGIFQIGVFFPYLGVKVIDALKTREGVDVTACIEKLFDAEGLDRNQAFEIIKTLEPTDKVIDLVANIGRYDGVSETAIEYLAELPASEFTTKAIGSIGARSRLNDICQRAIEILETREGEEATKAIKSLTSEFKSTRCDIVFDALVRRGAYDDACNLILSNTHWSEQHKFKFITTSEAVANVPEEHKAAFTKIASDAFAKMFASATSVTKTVSSSLSETLVRAAEKGNPLQLPLEEMGGNVKIAQDFYAMFKAK